MTMSPTSAIAILLTFATATAAIGIVASDAIARLL